jgi:ATP-binding cassette, subfamily B, bacterial
MTFENSKFTAWLGVPELRRAVQLVWRGSARWTLVGLGLGVAQAVLPLAGLYLLKRIIDAIVVVAGKGLGPGGFRLLALLISCALLLQILTAFCKAFAQVVQEEQSAQVTEYMQDLLHRKSIEVDLEYYETPAFKNTFHRAQQEGPYRPTRIVQGLAQLMQSGLSLIAVSGLLFFSIHWAFGVILAAAAVPGLLVRFRQTKRMFAWQVERTPIEREAEYYNWMLTGSHHAKENRLFGIGGVLKERAAELRRGLSQRRLKFAFQKSTGEFITQSTAALVTFGAFGLLTYRAVSGIISIGGLVMVYQAFQRGLAFFQEFLAGLANLYENNLFVRNVYAFLDQKAALPEQAHPCPMPRPIRQGIRFENVQFHYHDSDRPCLEDVSLAIEPGEVVALVGENGAGKSTLIKLLCRMYDPTGGRITIDGTDIRQFKKEDLRRAVSVVFQDYVQYGLSVRDNIWLGNINLPANDEAIVRSARAAGADAFIRKLNRGYDSILGNLFEGGEELSVGQWQKIALARAFLRPSELIVLDEPTSALDPKSEFEVFEKFRQLAADRSTLLISHRLSTVKMADRIYVLRGGRIVEHGTHEELVELGTDYANLYNTQAASYR